MKPEHVPLLKCPKCGNSLAFIVESSVNIFIHMIDGSAILKEYRDANIAPDGRCQCGHCNYYASIAIFRNQALHTKLASATITFGDALHRVT
jgi:ribosomal protein S27AE